MSSVSAAGYPAPGARIGRFRILEQLGQGGMGVVYRALEENLGREVALKIVAPHFAHDPEFRERFTREARAQASLESAHVVAVYAHGEEDGYLYIASQLVVDGDLGRLIRTAGVPPLVDALSVIEQVASGLADAHDAGLVHRDIKPGNVLVRIRDKAVRAYLADFGIARRMDAQATRFGSSAVGTPTYMAPELHGGADASLVTDVYSLGCLLWVALTGSPPYTGSSDYQIVAGHVQQPIPQLTGASPMVQATNRILRFAMAKEPAERYPSASAMRADLQAALRLPHQPGTAEPEQSGGTALRPLVSGVPSGSYHPTPSPTGPTPGDPGTANRWAPGNGGPTGPPPSSPPGMSPTGSPGGSYGTDPHERTTRGYHGPTGGGRRRRTGWLIAGVVAAVIALTGGVVAAVTIGDDGGGGGSDDPSTAAADLTEMTPEEILRASEKEMKVLDTVRVKGQFPDEDQGGKYIVVDMMVTANGDCSGTMGYVSGGQAQILRLDGRVMVKPDAGFLTNFQIDNAQQFLDYLGGRWLEFTDDPDQFASVCDLDEFLERDNRDGAELTNEGVVREQGQDAVKVHLQKGDQEETYFVMTAEPHYLLRINESANAWFRYSEFDEEFTQELPPDDEILKDTDVGKDG